MGIFSDLNSKDLKIEEGLEKAENIDFNNMESVGENSEDETHNNQRDIMEYAEGEAGSSEEDNDYRDLLARIQDNKVDNKGEVFEDDNISEKREGLTKTKKEDSHSTTPEETLKSAKMVTRPETKEKREEKQVKFFSIKDVRLPSIRKAVGEELDFFKQKPVISITKYRIYNQNKDRDKELVQHLPHISNQDRAEWHTGSQMS